MVHAEVSQVWGGIKVMKTNEQFPEPIKMGTDYDQWFKWLMDRIQLDCLIPTPEQEKVMRERLRAKVRHFARISQRGE